jgi:molybdopterin-biosynthesis enzyme MoeA-like protein
VFSIGTPLTEGAVYDSNRYTLWGMLIRLGCEVIDMGVVKDDPTALEAAFREAAGLRRCHHHQRRRFGRRGRFHQAADGAAR